MFCYARIYYTLQLFEKNLQILFETLFVSFTVPLRILDIVLCGILTFSAVKLSGRAQSLNLCYAELCLIIMLESAYFLLLETLQIRDGFFPNSLSI